MTSNTSIGSGTAAGALEYLDFLSSKGHVTPGAVAALKVGFKKVISVVDGESWQQTDVRSVNVDDYMNRFGNMTHGKYSLKSLADYRSRITKVIAWYQEFLKTPGWTPNVKVRQSKNDKSQSEPAKTSKATPEVSRADTATVSEAVSANVVNMQTKPGMVAFPFPLSDGQLANLYLPQTISAADADRMARFISTLVIEDAKHEQA